MKVWTVQQTGVLDILSAEKVYQPDFAKSDYLQLIPKLSALYEMMLESFNRINNVHVPGLIFGFSNTNGEPISSYYEFWALIQTKRAAIESLWKQLNKNDALIMELEYGDDVFNPLSIDINDFQFLMPPILMVPPYTERDLERIISCITRGVYLPSVFPSGIMQVHAPYIKAENVVNIYHSFDLD